jgi:hypothetical protein
MTKMFIKETDKETGKVLEYFSGTDFVWAKEQGFYEEEVEQAYNGTWYVAGHAPEKPLPTFEEISSLREKAYEKEVDKLHAQKNRKMVLGTWTQEDEEEYIKEVKARSESIAERYPYPQEEI